MKSVKLTKKAQDIVNQIMSADAVEIEHAHNNRAYTENTLLTSNGIQFSVQDDKNDEFIEISNATLNKAKISSDATIVIDANDIEENLHGDMTITLYSFIKLAAV